MEVVELKLMQGEFSVDDFVLVQGEGYFIGGFEAKMS